MKSKGLGDTIEKITKVTGIKRRLKRFPMEKIAGVVKDEIL